MTTRLGLLAVGTVSWTFAWVFTGGVQASEPEGAAGPVDKTGPVAHYTFDDPSGLILQDHYLTGVRLSLYTLDGRQLR